MPLEALTSGAHLEVEQEGWPLLAPRTVLLEALTLVAHLEAESQPPDAAARVQTMVRKPGPVPEGLQDDQALRIEARRTSRPCVWTSSNPVLTSCQLRWAFRRWNRRRTKPPQRQAARDNRPRASDSRASNRCIHRRCPRTVLWEVAAALLQECQELLEVLVMLFPTVLDAAAAKAHGHWASRLRARSRSILRRCQDPLAQEAAGLLPAVLEDMVLAVVDATAAVGNRTRASRP